MKSAVMTAIKNTLDKQKVLSILTRFNEYIIAHLKYDKLEKSSVAEQPNTFSKIIIIK